MADFHFALQALLDYRSHLVDQAQLELARAAGEHRSALVELERLRALERAGLGQLARENDRAAPGETLEVLRYLDLLGRRIAGQEDAVAALASSVARARERLAEALRERKMIERLRDRERAAFLARQRWLEAQRAQEATDQRVAADRQRAPGGPRGAPGLPGGLADRSQPDPADAPSGALQRELGFRPAPGEAAAGHGPEEGMRRSAA